MAGFAVAIGALTLLIGSAARPHDIVAPISGIVTLAIATVACAYSRPVRGGFSRRVYRAGWIGTGLLYAAALVAGILLGWPLWGWVIASIVVAIPLAVAAWTIYRSLR
ncbi:hypothetical protein FHU33_3531 [Blastococcus colisei]|uniref:Uncharacterized protein n=2 Tax=Blastococcus colisei TaxID=1564162 RepID=A0A543PJ00_9ACTN|nr:hypothetical protein FHU33_3531 [Blastococcus colisei]